MHYEWCFVCFNITYCVVIDCDIKVHEVMKMANMNILIIVIGSVVAAGTKPDLSILIILVCHTLPSHNTYSD